MSNTTITISPFPSQDLAKLVLGYLAEEQLMTAYDEFLQASPHLDALRNEYDRIFMTSLKNILAEYRAVKIYVETCKPFILRKKLFQCTNLLEIVKFLVNNVDINKLHLQEGGVDKYGCSRQSISKLNVCDVCISLKLPNCTCRNSQSASHIEASSLEKSVETTSLADLPGNTIQKKKIGKEFVTGNNISHSITSSDQIKDGGVLKSAKCLDSLSSTTCGSQIVSNVFSSITEKQFSQNQHSLDCQPEARQNVESLNDSINIISHNRHDSVCQKKDHSDTTCAKIGEIERLKKTATEDDNSNNKKVIVPDSSTSENVILTTSTPNAANNSNSISISKNIMRPPPLLIKIGTEHKKLNSPDNAFHSLTRIASSNEMLLKSSVKKTEEQFSPKITILSDVKVDNDMPSVLKGANSNSLVKMQTLFINGTPAYKNQKQGDQTFTKDEIMAMPTIILVPASDKTKKIVPTVTQNNMLNCLPATVSCSTSKIIEPLIIDVSSNEDTSCEMSYAGKNNSVVKPDKHINDNMLIKTVDVMSVNHTSLPKDNTLAALKTSTPQVPPPTRKSSSTPRRTSHVRVLDFTTPRRILHETLSEQEVNKCPSNEGLIEQDCKAPAKIKNNTEAIISKLDNVANVGTIAETKGDISGATKDKKATIKLYNWDSELRALAYVGNGNIVKSNPSQKSKSKKSKRKVSPTNKTSRNNKSGETKANKPNNKTNVAPKIETPKTRKKSIEANKTNDEIKEPPISVVKPTINIISQKKYDEPIESEKNLYKSSNNDEHVDTPELERMSLHNEIGAKLNISDFLETPYKQALYDIQMETPKFFGPDILDDPLSDIKIMNIPTPRFLNTPKLIQNTPSSYSSRPTDYSSGGSYYKPDDQDYVLGNEIIENNLSISSKVNKELKTEEIENVTVENKCEGKSRPVRKCTKNVSYKYNTPSSNKFKDVEEKTDKSSTCSETSVIKSEKKIDKHKISKPHKNDVVQQQTEPKKKSKKVKSPVKKETTKTFMKIKPRRTTPVKEILGRGRKKTGDLSQIVYVKPYPKKVIAGKEKNASFSPLSVVAIPTKSRRKSSTPRKLHTKKNNTECSEINSPERKKPISQCDMMQSTHLNAFSTQDSDCEQPSLRWSDDGSQDSKGKLNEDKTHPANESDDINKIKEYIKTTLHNDKGYSNEEAGTLQVDLIKRGFDVETARMIERDLLETPAPDLIKQNTPIPNIIQKIPSPISHENLNESKSRKSDKSIESDYSTSNNLQIVQSNNDNDEIDFSVQECNESTNNYFVYKYNESEFTASDQTKLKETFLMEICIENDVTIRLRAMPFNTAFEHESKSDGLDNCNGTLEKPVNPVHCDSLFTPRKAQFYEVFDSTLASLDTPLKSDSPKVKEFETVTEIVLEVEKLETDIKQKPETKKRRRVQSGTSDDSSNSSKKVKADTSYLLNSAGIQNIDIESVLSKLHGP